MFKQLLCIARNDVGVTSALAVSLPYFDKNTLLSMLARQNLLCSQNNTHICGTEYSWPPG